jgi:hypothetical protein
MSRDVRFVPKGDIRIAADHPQKFEQYDTSTISAKLFQRGSAHIL